MTRSRGKMNVSGFLLSALFAAFSPAATVPADVVNNLVQRLSEIEESLTLICTTESFKERKNAASALLKEARRQIALVVP